MFYTFVSDLFPLVLAIGAVHLALEGRAASVVFLFIAYITYTGIIDFDLFQGPGGPDDGDSDLWDKHS